MIPTIDRRTIRPASNDWPIPNKPITHEIHPTSLEQFMTCPYKFHAQEHPELFPNLKFWTSETARDAFYEWDITEQLMTAYQYGEKLWDQVLTNFGNSTEFPNYQRLKKHAENRKQYIASQSQAISDRFPLFTQKRMTIRILMDKTDAFLPQEYHEFYLSWTADRVYSDYTIADCKTSKSKWWKNEADFRLQRRLYPWMRKVTSNLPQLKKSSTFNFTYYVFTKQVTPQLQVIPLTYSYEDSERLIYHLLTEYKKAYDTDQREPKKCLWCKRCPLRQQCPLYGEDWLSSFSTPNPTIKDNENNSAERRF